MKKFLLVLAAMGMVFGLTACGGSDDKADKENVAKEESTYTSEEVVTKVTEGLELPAQMAMEGEMFADTYKIDKNVLDNYTVMMPMMSAHANEVAVFKVKDEKNVEMVKKAIETRATTAAENMLYPEQKALIEAHKIASKGKYVLYVVDENADKIVKNFEALIK